MMWLPKDSSKNQGDKQKKGPEWDTDGNITLDSAD
jgi:hypothetical protein